MPGHIVGDIGQPLVHQVELVEEHVVRGAAAGDRPSLGHDARHPQIGRKGVRQVRQSRLADEVDVRVGLIARRALDVERPEDRGLDAHDLGIQVVGDLAADASHELLEAIADLGRVLGFAELDRQALLRRHEEDADEVQARDDRQPADAAEKPEEVQPETADREDGADDVAARIQVALDPPQVHWYPRICLKMVWSDVVVASNTLPPVRLAIDVIASLLPLPNRTV